MKYVKERSRFYVFREHEKKCLAARPKAAANVCAMCKCELHQKRVYIYQRKKYHKVCFDVVYTRAKEAGTWNPRVAIAANGFAIGLAQASSLPKKKSGSATTTTKTATMLATRTLSRGMSRARVTLPVF